MQLEAHVKTDFCGGGLSGFKDFALFYLLSKTAKISFWTMDYSPWGLNNRIGLKIHAIRGPCEMHGN